MGFRPGGSGSCGAHVDAAIDDIAVATDATVATDAATALTTNDDI